MGAGNEAMDWFIDADDDGHGLTALRREMAAYLRRHATDPAAVDDAELVIAELLGNVVRHAPGPAWVTLDWSALRPVLTIRDLGPGFALDPRLPARLEAESGRGLFIAASLAQELSAAVRAAGGASVSAELALERPAAVSFHPRRRNGEGLPRPEEAEEGTGFGKDAFLRALVVELAQTLEEHHGPAAAEAAVAQAGTDIGGQMEAEYRNAAGLEDGVDLTPEQMGACFVRLKHAIDGDFSLLEVDAHHLVLVNRRCPFGEVVRRAPALCRMTSAVFGGIAAANAEREASVVLEERIAVGDAACRVAVYLDHPPPDPRVAHRYPAPIAERDRATSRQAR